MKAKSKQANPFEEKIEAPKADSNVAASPKGARPISEKRVKGGIVTAADAGFSNNFDIPEALQAELDEKGLEGRFIYVKNLFQGVHQRGWKPYKRESRAMIGQDFLFGASPDGYVRCGDLVLGVKTKEQCDNHRALLRQKALKQSAGHSKAKAEELANLTRTKVVEGYDANE